MNDLFTFILVILIICTIGAFIEWWIHLIRRARRRRRTVEEQQQLNDTIYHYYSSPSPIRPGSYLEPITEEEAV